MILIIDCGSQSTHLIGRRVRELGVSIVITDPEEALEHISIHHPSGVIISGGPLSVYDAGAPSISPAIYDQNLPVLGICYGWQLTAQVLGGKVESGHKEYGPTQITLTAESPLFEHITQKEYTVWMSHGDEVTQLPEGFEYCAATPSVRAGAVQYLDKRIFGLQFHPELEHTQYGTRILRNFIEHICGETITHQILDVKTVISSIQQIVPAGEDVIAISAVSGGVDSTVASAIVAKAIGKRFVPVYCDNGLMREGTTQEVQYIFGELLGIKPVIIDCKDRFLSALAGVTDPEKKRKIIGALYVTEFETVLQQYPTAQYLVQGTLYSDVIESSGTKHASQVRIHHNVAGLPKNMKLTLLEPNKEYYKDQVRILGKQLGLPDEVLHKQPFPGPGQAIRILGEVTVERLARQQQADTIVLEVLKQTGWYEKVFQSFSILTQAHSTGVKGDVRFMGEVVAVRCYDSSDIMSAGWTHLPYEVLQRISTRIVNEVPGVSRVVYDITTKPPATMEWQ